jgi:hypothetical protein
VKKAFLCFLASHQKISLPRIDNPAVNTGTFFPLSTEFFFTEIDTLEYHQTEKIEGEVNVDRIRKHTGVRNTVQGTHLIVLFMYGI